MSLDEKGVVDTRDCAVDIKDKSYEPKEIGSPTKGRNWELNGERYYLSLNTCNKGGL